MFCSLGVLATKEEEDEESCDKPTTSRANKKISALKNICELKRPEVCIIIFFLPMTTILLPFI